MRNKRQIIFLIIGTLLFSFMIYSLASRDHSIKKARFATNARVIKAAMIYEAADKNSKIVDSLPQDTNITVGRERSNFYRLIKVEGDSNVKEGFLHKEVVIKKE